MKQVLQKEELRRIAMPSGNSSHVILPKEWEGYEVILTRVETDPKKDILDALEPYFSDIIGVYLYGSHARKEHGKESDIDVMVITNKKLDIEVKKPFDVTQVVKDKLERFKEINPVLFYSFLFEAEPIMNSSFLEDLRRKELGKFKSAFNEYLKDTTSALKINKGLLDISKSRSEEYADGNLIYSLILRLRGMYIIETMLNKERFSNESFMKFLKEKLNVEPQEYYAIYRAIRDEKRPKNNISIEDTRRLLNLLEELLNDIRLKLKHDK